MKSMVSRVNNSEDGLVATNKIFSSLIERAQKKREAMLYSMRKHVLSYDDVMNVQRQIIYKERNKVLDGDDIHEQVQAMLDEYMKDRIPEILSMETDEGVVDVEGINHALNAEMIPTNGDYLEEEDFDLTQDEAYEKVVNKINDILDKKRQYIDEFGAEYGMDYLTFERDMMLRAVDMHWMEHIDMMDSLRKGIGLRSYGGVDPVTAYKKEGTDMFNDMTDRIKRDTAKFVMRTGITIKTGQNQMQNPQRRTPAKSDKVVGRNDKCPCGSGKKYKNCCGRN